MEHAAVGGEEKGHLAVGGGGCVGFFIGFSGEVEAIFDLAVLEAGPKLQEDYVNKCYAASS